MGDMTVFDYQAPETPDPKLLDAAVTEPLTPEVTAEPIAAPSPELEQLKRMHRESQAMIQRQANEIGQLRRQVYSAPPSNGEQPVSKPRNEEPPSEVQAQVQQAMEPYLGLLANQAVKEFRSELTSKHGDNWEDVSNSPGFEAWVQENPARMQLLYAASNLLDVSAASELLSSYQAGQRERDAGPAVPEMELGGAPGGYGTGKSYRAVDLQRLKINQPERYEAMVASGEIDRLYREGRVIR